MSPRRRQLGFLLNPYRHAGTVQSGSLSMGGAAVMTMAGAGVGASALSAAGIAAMEMENAQAGSGSISAAGASVATFGGASRAAGAMNPAGVGTATWASATTAATVDAADFDGVDDRLNRESAMTGQTSSKTGIFSGWIFADSLNGLFVMQCENLSGFDHAFAVSVGGTGVLTIIGADTTQYVLTIATNSSAISTGTWHHILASWDVATGAHHLYVDDVSNVDAAQTVTVNSNLLWADISVYAVAARKLFGSSTYADEWDGGLAEPVVAPGQFLDFSVEANRRKYITSDGKPANLGSTGATPTGTSPLVYLHLDDGETANNFAINRGTGGNLTVSGGGLATRPTSPSD